MARTTVVIPNYNGERFLPDCMEALSHETVRDFDTVVVDNGSVDGSLAWLSKWQAEDVKRRALIRNGENLGFSAAVNEGIHWAMERGSRYVLLLNNDTKVRPDFLEKLERAMERDRAGKVFAISSLMLKMHDPGIVDDAGDEYTVLGWQFQRGLDQPRERWQKAGRVFSACAGAALYRVEALKSTGLFDERHFAYLEDMDISFRANLYGYRVYFLPAAVCLHVGSGTSGSKYNPFKVRLSARNSVYLLYKNMPLAFLLLNLPGILLGYCVKCAFFIRRGFGRAYISGVWEGLSSLRGLKRASFCEVPFSRYLFLEVRMLRATFAYIGKKLGDSKKEKHGNEGGSPGKR